VAGDGRPRIGWLGDSRATDAVPVALGPALPDLLGPDVRRVLVVHPSALATTADTVREATEMRWQYMTGLHRAFVLKEDA